MLFNVTAVVDGSALDVIEFVVPAEEARRSDKLRDYVVIVDNHVVILIR